MKELKTKGGFTIFATICIVLSILGGMACIPAAKGMNSVWHMMFPQYVESNQVRLIVRMAPSTNEGHTAPATYLGPVKAPRIGKCGLNVLDPADLTKYR